MDLGEEQKELQVEPLAWPEPQKHEQPYAQPVEKPIQEPVAP